MLFYGLFGENFEQAFFVLPSHSLTEKRWQTPVVFDAFLVSLDESIKCSQSIHLNSALSPESFAGINLCFLQKKSS